MRRPSVFFIFFLLLFILTIQYGTPEFNVYVAASPSDFRIEAVPSEIRINRGGSQESNIIVSSLNGFSSSVSLEVLGNTSSVKATFDRSQVFVLPSQSTVSILSIAVDISAAPDTYVLTILGTNGTLYRKTSITLNITDFNMEITPDSQTIVQGDEASYAIKVCSVLGFHDSVSLTVGKQLGLGTRFEPDQVRPSPEKPSSSELIVSTSPLTQPGEYDLTISGTCGKIVQNTTVKLLVLSAEGFRIKAYPTSQTVSAGYATKYNVTLIQLFGYNGSVSLEVSGLPAGSSCIFSLTKVSFQKNMMMTLTLIVKTSSATPSGNYTLTITGIDEKGKKHDANVTLNVVPPSEMYVQTYAPIILIVEQIIIITLAIVLLATHKYHS